MKKLFKNIRAFTLAEVLIALTVIGVISALTIPNVTKNIQAAHSKTAFKKTLAEINTAIADFAANEGKTLAETAANSEIQNLFTNYMGAKTLATVADLQSPETSAWPIVYNLSSTDSNSNNVINITSVGVASQLIIGTYYILPNSTSIIVPSNIYSCGKPRINTNSGYTNNANNACLIYIDTNGRKGPNQQLMGVTSTSGDSDACAKIVEPNGDYMVKVGAGSAKYCQLTDDAVTDIYPVVLYNDRAYPATVAGYWVLNDLIGQDI